MKTQIIPKSLTILIVSFFLSIQVFGASQSEILNNFLQKIDKKLVTLNKGEIIKLFGEYDLSEKQINQHFKTLSKSTDIIDITFLLLKKNNKYVFNSVILTLKNLTNGDRISLKKKIVSSNTRRFSKSIHQSKNFDESELAFWNLSPPWIMKLYLSPTKISKPGSIAYIPINRRKDNYIQITVMLSEYD